ncbi:MAG: hypothetical protein ACLQOO_11185 [Terriglobia bacterium]
MKRVVFAGILFLLVSLHAIAQVEAGTLVVLNSSQDEIAVAADSRTHNATTYIDNRCKISALGNELIFAASGKTGYGPLGGANLVWDSHAIAHDKFRMIAHNKRTQNLPLRLATSWGRKVKRQLQLDLIHDRDETLSGVVGDTLTSALFAGFNAKGISIITGKITYRFTPKGKPITTFTITNEFERPRAVFIGDTGIADEFSASTTTRAVQWRQEASIQAAKAQDAVALFAIKIVDLSIEYSPGMIIDGKIIPSIGGPVDALRLVRGHGIEWIQRKANCPAN